MRNIGFLGRWGTYQALSWAEGPARLRLASARLLPSHCVTHTSVAPAMPSAMVWYGAQAQPKIISSQQKPESQNLPLHMYLADW